MDSWRHARELNRYKLYNLEWTAWLISFWIAWPILQLTWRSSTHWLWLLVFLEPVSRSPAFHTLLGVVETIRRLKFSEFFLKKWNFFGGLNIYIFKKNIFSVSEIVRLNSKIGIFSVSKIIILNDLNLAKIKLNFFLNLMFPCFLLN
jgi:hypothetical protein